MDQPHRSRIQEVSSGARGIFRNRFESILGFPHISYNEGPSEENRLYKINTMVRILNP